MDYFLLLVASLIPGILWVWFFYRQDRSEPEPRRLVIRAFIYGMAAVVPTALIEMPFGSLFRQPVNLAVLLLGTIFIVGLAEEYAKYLAVRLSVFSSTEFNEVMDGIIYAVAAGLGFAAVENLFYAINFGIKVVPIRGLITSLAHASFSGILGFYLGVAKVLPQYEKPLIRRGLTYAVVLHGFYDFLLLSRLLNPVYVVLLLLVVYRFLSSRIKRAGELSPFKRDNG